ncbi:MAG TPA: hypothetical protein VGI67_16555 [Thermoleophilaceae bacterium]
MSVPRKLLASLVVIGLAAVCLAAATWSSFSTTTANPSNAFSAGTVALSDNDAGSAFSSPTLSPGGSASGCIKVSYSGSLAAAVHLYASTTGPLAQYLNVSVTRGTQTSPTFPSCTGFSADSTNYIGSGAGVVYSGTLANLSSTYTNYANGLVDAPGAAQTWTSGSAHAYMITVSLPSGVPAAAQGLSSSATFTWEAQNT